jgi:hypothetical protein
MERSSNYTMSRVGGATRTFSGYTDACTLNGRDARFISSMSAQVAPRFRLARGTFVVKEIFLVIKI